MYMCVSLPICISFWTSTLSSRNAHTHRYTSHSSYTLSLSRFLLYKYPDVKKKNHYVLLPGGPVSSRAHFTLAVSS